MKTTYPKSAGHRGVDTSIEAADVINEQLPRLQRSVLGVIEDRGAMGATSDEIATALGWERFRVRPRTSELRAAKRITDSKRRRPSLSGVSSIVWVLADGGGQ